MEKHLERILILGISKKFLPLFLSNHANIKLNFLYGEDMDGFEKYGNNEKFNNKLINITKNKEVDSVIIQNNMKYGLEKATSVNEEMRPEQTFIVWTYDPDEREKFSYRQLGIKNLISLNNLGEAFKRYLAKKYSE